MLVVGLHGAGKEHQERPSVLGLKRTVTRQDLAGDGDTGGLAAPGNQTLGQLADILGAIEPCQRARQQLPALLGDRVQKFLQEGNVQGVGLSHRPR